MSDNKESIIANLDQVHLERLAEEFKRNKEAIEIMEKRQSDMKKQLLEAVEVFGITDDKGHQWLKLGSHEIKRERRVSRSFNAPAAEAWAKENDYWDSVKEVIEVASEEKVLGLAWANKELSDIVSDFYTEKETWAFKL